MTEDRLGQFSFETNSQDEDFAVGVKFQFQPKEGGLKVRLDLGEMAEEYGLVEAGFDYSMDSHQEGGGPLSAGELNLYGMTGGKIKLRAKLESSPGLITLSAITSDDNHKTMKLEANYENIPAELKLSGFYNDDLVTTLMLEMKSPKNYKWTFLFLPAELTYVIELLHEDTLYKATLTRNDVLKHTLKCLSLIHI